jgi:hypothetical protein
MDTGTIQRTITLFKDALEGLRANISLIELEDVAIMIHKAMTVQARTFHTPEHIFDLADASNPILALAALFHDIVYYQVDEGFIPEIHEVLAPYIKEEGGQIALVDHMSSEDIALAFTLKVFGFELGQTLYAFNGLNEFLSALVMNKKLEGFVNDTNLLKTTICIEATIPFRGRNERNETPADVLARRLQNINEQYELEMSSDEIKQAVKWAVVFSNKDVDNFSEQETGKFLDNTWKLLPETNPALRWRGIYSIQNYRRALQKMERFLGSLNPEHIFNSYKGEPEEGDYQRMVAMAYRNVFTAREYLGIKLLSAGILEAMANITGGDAPVALFMGDFEETEDSRHVGHLLPKAQTAPLVDVGSTVFGLLAFGRASASSFDMQNSPLSLFVYKQLGPDSVRHYLDLAWSMFDGELEPQAFLDELPIDLIVPIASACSELAITRRSALQAYAASRAELDV